MQKIKGIGFILGLSLILCACNNKNEIVNVTKQGTEYIYESASFFYPNKFNMEDDNENGDVKVPSQTKNTSIKISHKEEIIELEVSDVVEDNVESELIQLYKVDLETMGYTVISNTKVNLDNGDSCYEVVIEDSDVKAKHMVIYENNLRYVLKYEAPSNEFDKKILKMDKYLYTFVVKEHGEKDHLH